MRQRQRHTLPYSLTLIPGDTLNCTVQDGATGRAITFTEEIGRTLDVDTVVTFDVDTPLLGISDGIGAVFGNAVEKSSPTPRRSPWLKKLVNLIRGH